MLALLRRHFLPSFSLGLMLGAFTAWIVWNG